jgi:hypothetical protein
MSVFPSVCWSSWPPPMISHLFAVAIALVVIAGLIWAALTLFADELTPVVWDMRFGDQALQIVLFHVFPTRRIPYGDIAAAAATTRRQLKFRHASGKSSVTGLINRSSPLVIIYRHSTSRVVAYTPANRDRFLRELNARMTRARAVHRSRMRTSGGGVAA